MGKYDVKVRYIFEGTYTVVAEDREEAESMVAEDCGLVLGGNIHTTRDDDEVTDWKFGINSATYIGYTAVHNAGYSETMSILGSCLTTFAVCLPSFLLVLLISYFFAKFRNNKYVEAAFLGLRPATVGLIAAAALLLMNKENFIDYKSFLIFGAAFILTWKFKVHPILMIILAGIAGIILYW